MKDLLKLDNACFNQGQDIRVVQTLQEGVDTSQDEKPKIKITYLNILFIIFYRAVYRSI